MTAKRAYVVVGPESSGNRLVAALLIRAGCLGEASMRAPDALPVHEDPVVLLRSYPHGPDWPDLRTIVGQLRDTGYLVRVIVLARDPWCLACSQLERHHHPLELAAANVRAAYALIFRQLAQLNVWWTLVPYEALILHPHQAVRRLLESLDLPTSNLGGPLTVEGTETTELTDANAKWHAIAEVTDGALE